MEGNLSIKYRSDIDGLRAIAVLAVVLYHGFPEYLPGGFAGVDVFFVISGFLISSIIFKEIAEKKFTFAMFYSRRIRRIFPALITILIATLAMGYFFLKPNELNSLGLHLTAASTFGSNILLWNESGYFDTQSKFKPLLHLWSLGIEEQFYIIWPLLVFYIHKFDKKNVAKLIFLIIISSFALNLFLIKKNPEATFYLPFTRFWELLIGCGLAYSFTYHNQFVKKYFEKFASLFSILGVSLIFSSFFFLKESQPFPGFLALIPTMGAFFYIAASETAIMNRMASKLTYIGLISYPLYLWHWPVNFYLNNIFTLSKDLFIYKAGAIIFSIVLASMTYHLIEKQVRRFNNQILIPILTLILFTLGGTGYYLHYNDGSFQYIPSAIKPFYNSNYDYAEEYRLHNCFMVPSGTDFKEFCKMNDFPNGKKVLLWGDSLAAHLYQGLKVIAKKNEFNLIQYTGSACPPIFYTDLENPYCKNLNKIILEKILSIKPDIIIMSGNWLAYKEVNQKNLVDTIKTVKAAKVILIGPFPYFKLNPSSTVIINYSISHKVSDYDDPSNLEVSEKLKIKDNEFQAFALSNNIDYLSPVELMCPNLSCLISTKIDNRSEPIYWDNIHYGRAGSIYFVENFLQEVIKKNAK